MPLIPGTTKRVLSAVNYAAPAKGSGLLLRGATSGSSGMIAAVAGPTIKYTLPASAPASDGESLTSTIAGVMSWAVSGGSPANNDGAVQFNDNGSFGGDSAKFFWDNVNKRLGIGTSSPTGVLHLFEGASDQILVIEKLGGTTKKMISFVSNTGSEISFFEMDTDENFVWNYNRPFKFNNDSSNGTWTFGNTTSSLGHLNVLSPNTGVNRTAFRVDQNDPAGDIINFIGASEVFTVLYDGKTGINETAPDAMLEIVTKSSTTQGLYIKGSASQTASLFRITDSADLDTINFDDGLAGGTVVFNEQGADIDFRVESDNAANLLFLDAGLDTGAGGIGLFGTAPQVQQATIVDADGTLADVTNKLNTLLAALEGYGLLKSS